MVIFTTLSNTPVTISTKFNSLTISLEDSSGTSVYSFDKSGRLWTALENGISYRRGLNGKIVAKWNSGREVLHRRYLSPPEANDLLLKSHEICQRLSNLINNGTLLTSQPIPPSLEREIDHFAQIDLNFYNQDIQNYHHVYCPIGILPPDQYMSLVLQLTEGCSFNTCTFCNFYKDRPFRIKQADEFEQHVVSVKRFLGESLNLRRTIFIGDANALVVPPRMLLSRLDLIHKHLDVEGLGGLFAFLDGFSAEKKSPQDYMTLARLGFKRIYIGLESGNDRLLRFLKKPGTSKDVLKSVNEIKSAGIAVAIILLIGAGGKQYARDHIGDSIRLVNQMQLDADDIIYLSELVEEEGMEYAREAYQAELEPLTAEERQFQGEEIVAALQFSTRGTPHISRYDIRDFVY